MKYLLTMLCVAALLCSCGKDHPEEPVITSAKRTVLVYMAAENNLSSYATNDLNEMRVGSKSIGDDSHLIVYVDQASNTTPPYIARVKDGILVDSVSMEESLTADPAVLEKMLRYAVEHYPADDYGLILWGHANGWLFRNDSVTYAQTRAYGGDTGNNTSSASGYYWMNIPSMAKAITNAMGNSKLKFIQGDCCNFGGIEVAYELRNTADYIIASPAEIPDPGAPFDQTVPAMFSTSENFCQYVADKYYDYYKDKYQNDPNDYISYNQTPGDLSGYSVPMAVIKTSELEALATATANLLKTIPEKVTYPSFPDMEGVAFYAYDASYYSSLNGYKHSYDIRNVFKNNANEADYNNWLTVFNRAVPYRLHSDQWMTAFNGLYNTFGKFTENEESCGAVGMFFPGIAYQNTSPCWNKTIQRMAWNNVIHWEQYGW